MTLTNFTRWLYRGQRPNWIARILNSATAGVASSGVASDYLVTLEVTGRRSGRMISLPVVIAIVDGQRYLVSMLGDNVQWVQNVRAAGGRAVLRSGGREEVQLEEVPVDQRPPILRAYLQRAPGARAHVPVNKDAALAEFQSVAAAFPVFRVASSRRCSRRIPVGHAADQRLTRFAPKGGRLQERAATAATWCQTTEDQLKMGFSGIC